MTCDVSNLTCRTGLQTQDKQINKHAISKEHEPRLNAITPSSRHKYLQAQAHHAVAMCHALQAVSHDTHKGHDMHKGHTKEF